MNCNSFAVSQLMPQAFSSNTTPAEYTVIPHVASPTSTMPCLWSAMVQMKAQELIIGSSKTGIAMQ